MRKAWRREIESIAMKTRTSTLKRPPIVRKRGSVSPLYLIKQELCPMSQFVLALDKIYL
jgi:hypothetical protein